MDGVSPLWLTHSGRPLRPPSEFNLEADKRDQLLDVDALRCAPVRFDLPGNGRVERRRLGRPEGRCRLARIVAALAAADAFEEIVAEPRCRAACLGGVGFGGAGFAGAFGGGLGEAAGLGTALGFGTGRAGSGSTAGSGTGASTGATAACSCAEGSGEVDVSATSSARLTVIRSGIGSGVGASRTCHISPATSATCASAAMTTPIRSSRVRLASAAMAIGLWSLD